MRNIITILLTFACILLGVATQAQTALNYTIKGSVIDSATMKPIGFATIILRDSLPVKAIAAGPDGKFSIKYDKQGKFTVQVTFVGYMTQERQVELKSEKTIDLGDIYLGAGVQIGEVVVVGQLITSDIDKTIYHAGVDPETPSLTALEMMRKVPMLSVDGDDNLQLKGQGNYKILVNGKTNTLMSKNYKDVLRSMPASSIKNIEVITNPPAKYDAEGVAGIINIITERKTNNGYNGSLSVRGDHFGGIGGSGYIAASLGKVTLSANFGTGSYKQPKMRGWSKMVNELSEDARFMNQNNDSKSRNLGNNLSFDVSYEVDTFNLVSVSFWGYLGNYKSNSYTHTEYLDAQEVFKYGYDNITESTGKYGGFSGNIDWQRTYMKPDKTLTMSYRFDGNPGSRGYQSDLIGVNYADRHQRSDNTSMGSEHTFQVDYFDPLTKKHTIEGGAKFVLRPNTSDTYNETMLLDVWEEDLSRKNDLDYLQYIMSAYASYQFKLKKFSVKGGFRAEFTINTGTFKSKVNNDVFNRYFNVVPYLTTSYKFTDSQNIRLGYTQRLQRPGIWYLNPYLDDEDPKHVSQGNPDLESEIRHTFDLAYNVFTPKWNVGVNASANFSNNAIENITTIKEGDVMFSTYENYGKRQNYSAYMFGGINLLEGKMRINLNANVSYSIVESVNNPALNNSGYNFGGGGSFYAETWKNANVNLYASYYSSSVGLQSKSAGQFYSSINVSQGFLKDKKLRLNLSVSNPFETKKTHRYDSFGVGYRSESAFTYYSRRINLSLQWNFGKMMTQVKKARRGINNDDKMNSGGAETSAAK